MICVIQSLYGAIICQYCCNAVLYVAARSRMEATKGNATFANMARTALFEGESKTSLDASPATDSRECGRRGWGGSILHRPGKSFGATSLSSSQRHEGRRITPMTQPKGGQWRPFAEYYIEPPSNFEGLEEILLSTGVVAAVDRLSDELTALSRKIWEFAEVGLQEHRSAEAQADLLEKAGFEVQRGVAGMPTAFVASYGTARPVIGLLGEYDALPGLSQKVVAEKEPLNEGAAGHGCGHNLLGVAAVGAALAVKEAIENGEVQGTVRYYGCPAEETLVGKVFMVREGLFDDVDAALTWHPMSVNGVWNASSLALNSAKFRFFGRTSHAAADPEAGRSALDAVELMNVGANYLREHVPSEARMHYVVTNGGGEPNVVPAEAEVWYYVRAPRRDDVDDIYARLLKIAEGATLMTETTHEVEVLAACYNVLPNQVLGHLLQDKLEEVGPPAFDERDIEFAAEIQNSFVPAQFKRALEFLKKRGVEDEVLHQGVTEFKFEDKPMSGSTDVADVSGWHTRTLLADGRSQRLRFWPEGHADCHKGSCSGRAGVAAKRRPAGKGKSRV